MEASNDNKRLSDVEDDKSLEIKKSEEEAAIKHRKEERKREKKELFESLQDSDSDSYSEELVERLCAPSSSSSVDSQELETIKRTIEKIKLQPILWERQTESVVKKSEPEIDKNECMVQIADEMYDCKKEILSKFCLLFESNVSEYIDLTPLNISQDSFVDSYMWMSEREDTALNIFIKQHNVVELFKTAVVLEIPKLKEDIFIVFRENSDIKVLLSLFSEILEKKYQNIVKEFCDFLISNINVLKFIQSAEFLNVNVDILELIGSSDFFAFQSEKHMLYTIVFWLSHNWDDRRKYTTRLLSCVRLGLLTPYEIVKLKHEKDIQHVILDPDSEEFIEKCIAYAVYFKTYGNNAKKLEKECEEGHIPIPKPRYSENLALKPDYDCYKDFVGYVKQNDSCEKTSDKSVN